MHVVITYYVVSCTTIFWLKLVVSNSNYYKSRSREKYKNVISVLSLNLYSVRTYFINRWGPGSQVIIINKIYYEYTK